MDTIDTADSARARGGRHARGPAAPPPGGLRAAFGRAAAHTAGAVGSPWAFLLAVGIVVVWALTGPLFGFSDTWQLVINTGTTIVTFLMVFLIQNTQNRDAKAIHLKLDELIRAARAARNELIDIEEDTDEDLALLQREYRELHTRAAAVAAQMDAARAGRRRPAAGGQGTAAAVGSSRAGQPTGEAAPGARPAGRESDDAGSPRLVDDARDQGHPASSA
jgi:low affinity Fe/Cu permease